jgi:protein arginine kinase activator
MKACSVCGAADGVVDLTHIEGGEVRTRHLCAKCAAEKGIQTPGGLADSPLGGLLAALGSESSSLPVSQPAAHCSGCGGTLQDFRDSGRLGCAQCYVAFEEPLKELMRRLHGSTHHTGKPYQGPGTPKEEAAPEATHRLKEQLRQAIGAEQFERAARLRDELKERGEWT